jgi:hypothetical protein
MLDCRATENNNKYDIHTLVFYVRVCVYTYDIHLLNLNPVDNSDQSLQDTMLIKANLISRIPTIIINSGKDTRICV